jgi:protocatechuate 3,4-dioxygenase alpha subunit
MSTKKKIKQTPSQTAGPYLHIGLLPKKVGINSSFSRELNNLILSEKTKGTRIEISGKIYDGNNEVLKDALVEIWQVDSNGNYQSRLTKKTKYDKNFSNWGRTSCDINTGLWKFNTIKPGIVQLNKSEILAPHIWFWIVARGINLGLYTCMYFSDENTLNKLDRNLKKFTNNNLQSLFAVNIEKYKYEFNIYLQGDKETIFFNV